MQVLKGGSAVLWIMVGIPLTFIGVLTALSLVFSLLGIVSMFIAFAVPFGLVPPVLGWLFKARHSSKIIN